MKNRGLEKFGVIDKDYQRVRLKEGDVCEVHDEEGKGYIANYPQILCKVESDEEGQ